MDWTKDSDPAHNGPMSLFDKERQRGRPVFLVPLLFLICSCGSGEKGQGDWVLPESERVLYDVDCEAACAVERRCQAWPEDQDCLGECQGMTAKGGLQKSHLEDWATCLLSLGDSCSRRDVDACRRQAQTVCARPDELDALADAWCRKWLTCSGAPVDRYLDRCLGDLDGLPDMGLLACMSPAALRRFGDCAEAADCSTLSDWPLLQLCWSIYL